MSAGETGPNPSEGLHPRIIAEQKQAELEVLWPSLQEEIEMWNLRLEQARSRSDGQLDDLAGEATRSLDEKWPFVGDYFLVSGMWRRPNVGVTRGGISWDYSQQSYALDIAASFGFGVSDEDNDCPRVKMAFISGKAQFESAKVYGSLSFSNLADPSEISLTFVRPGDLDNNQLRQRTSETIVYYDSLLELYLKDEHSSFYRESWSKQKRFFESIVDDASQVMSAPGVIIPAEVMVPYAYIRSSDTDGYPYKKISAVNEGDLLLFGGIIECASILEINRSNAQPIRSPDELIDIDAGLCVVLKLNEQLGVDDNFTASHIIVPTRQVDELSLYPDS